MSLLPFFVLTEAAAVAALLTRRSTGLSLAIGLGGLAVALAAALAIAPGETLIIGDAAVVTSSYQRLFLVLGSLAGLLACILGIATTSQRNVPAAILASLGWTGLALALPETTTAVLATACAGLAGILVILAPVSGPGVGVSARELRTVGVSTALAVAGVAVVAGSAPAGSDLAVAPLGAVGLEPAVLGLAYLGVVVAVALRLGVIPFHGWAGRLSRAAPEAALPLLLAWGPAGLAVVVMAWLDTSILPVAPPLDLERGIVAAIGVLTLVLGTFAVWIQDDVEHVVGYSIAQDAGFVILALAALTPTAWGPAREWILVFALAKTALAGWALVVRARHGSRRIDDLAGWARRSPILGLAFVAIVLATIGWPGSMAWEARSGLAHLAFSDPIATLVLVGALSSLAYYGRLAVIGVRPPAGAGGFDAATLLRWPTRLGSSRRAEAPAAETPTAGGPATEGATTGGGRPSGRPETAAELAAAELVRALTRVRHAVGDVAGGWRTNRAPVATLMVALLSLSAIVAAAGGLGIPEAAAEPVPAAFLPLPTASPEVPAASSSPEGTSGPAESPAGSPSPSREPAASAPVGSPSAGSPSPSEAPSASSTAP